MDFWGRWNPVSPWQATYALWDSGYPSSLPGIQQRPCDSCVLGTGNSVNKISNICHITEYVVQDNPSTMDSLGQIIFLPGPVLCTVGCL